MTDRDHPKQLLWINQFAVTPREGGGTRHYELVGELGKLGWTTCVAASDLNLHSRHYSRRANGHQREVIREKTPGGQFHWHWAAPYERNNHRRALNWITFSRSVLRNSSAEGRPDVVIGSSPHLFAAWAGACLANQLRVPFVFEVRDLWPETLLAAGFDRGIAYHFLAAVARRLYRTADLILVLARGAGRYLETEFAVPRSKIVFVPNGVDVSAFDCCARSPRTGLTLLYAGAHGPLNGLDVLLDAAEKLRSNESIRFLLVGDGPLKPSLVEEASRRRLSNVEFRPPVPKERIPEVLREADAGLMLLKEAPLFGFGVSPNKLFDYFAAGLPVVCNVPGEVAEAVSSAAAGEQADPGCADSLAATIVRLAKRDLQERRAMGERGREWVQREHDRPVLAARLDEALRALLN